MLPACSQLFHTSHQFFLPLLASSTAAASPSQSQVPVGPMAHHHSPSPSRRLSELLGEQQEPFYLDLYLLEKGCSPAFLDAAACGGRGACSTCWPTRARSTGGRPLLRTPARSKLGRGVLRLLLSKILSGAGAATAPAAAAKKKKKRLQPAAAIDWRRADGDAGEKQSTPGRSANASVPASPSAIECHHQTEEVDEEREEDEEEDESSKKQLSPVSVLEQRLFEHSPPPPPHAQKAFVLFSELLEAAYTPTTLVHLLANARRYSVSASSKDGRRRRSSDGGSTTPATRRRRSRNSSNNNNNHARARRDAEDDDATFERDLAMATALVASELGGARVRAEDVGPEREDVAGDVAAAVLDALTEEAAAELMRMGMDRGCAADTAATATSVVGFLVG